MIELYYSLEEMEEKAKELFAHEREIKRLDGWFRVEEIYLKTLETSQREAHVLKTSEALKNVVSQLPIYIDENNIFAGSPRDAFARSYALINPNFRVSTFEGYCVPTEVFHDIEPNEEFSRERIEEARGKLEKTKYIKELTAVYDEARTDMDEVAYFVEQVNAHVIPDFRPAIRLGVQKLQEELKERLKGDLPEKKCWQYQAMCETLECVVILAERYAEAAERDAGTADEGRRKQLLLLAETLHKVPRYGATNLYEAIQTYILLWQVMCLEQTPNPSAFSVGNADRIFEPYREMEGLDRAYAAGLFKHFLVMFNVGDRSWAVSQNVLISGRDEQGNDLTNLSSYALMDAYFAMNLPQPILSVKLHKHTPDQLYREMGRFFFTAGCLTPSLFNDDALFELLKKRGVDVEDIPDCAVAGCQEPLIMGKDNGNTTNSWLNLAKVLELALNDGKSLLSGTQIAPNWEEMGIEQRTSQYVLENIHAIFESYLDYFVERMTKNANGASVAMSNLPVPFLSCFMGGMESGIDMRDASEQGTKYNGSGCLIHGVTVVADSFVAIEQLLQERPKDSDRLLQALRTNFKGDEELHQYLLCCEKFGNNSKKVDEEAAALAILASDKVEAKVNYLGNPFRPDFATPSTHLIYGSKVGAMPSGRKAKEMLNYGVDPLYGEAQHGLGFRTMSVKKLPYERFVGGYASHLGLDPKYFVSADVGEKGLEFKKKIIMPLFFSTESGVAPFYLYVNVTTPDILRKVLENPKKYAPSGIYIVRIHGTFVNFLDLSPEIQDDIIKRLDLPSTAC